MGALSLTHCRVPVRIHATSIRRGWGEFPAPSFTGHDLGVLPLSHVVGALGVQPPPSWIHPIQAVLGGVPSTSGGVESDY